MTITTPAATCNADEAAYASLRARGLRPVSELAQKRPHGDRLRYLAGCRCADCRRANTSYEKTRAAARKAGDWNGIVPADKARAHMADLSTRGVGRRTVCDVAGVADSVLTEIIAGRKARIRARTERAILAVTERAAADQAHVDATPTWRLLDRLLAWGYRKAELARALGYSTPALQLKRGRVTVRTAFEVARVYERLRLVDARATLELLDELSAEGFHRNRIARQLRELADKLGADAPDLALRPWARGHLQGSLIRHSTAELVRDLHGQLTA